MMNPFKRRAELAQAEADEARANPSLADLEMDDHARAVEAARVATIVARTERARAKQLAADELQRRADALDAAVTEHADAAAREGKRLVAVSKALTASRAGMATKVKAAESALAELLDAAEAHDALVQQSAGELRAADLPAVYEDGDVRHEFTTGGTPADGLVLDGKWWSRVSPAAVALRAVYAVSRARDGAFTGLAGELRMRADVQRVLTRTGDLFPPLPAARVPEAPSWRGVLDDASQAFAADLAASHVVSESQREDIERARASDEREAQQATVRLHRAAQQVADNPRLPGVFA